MLGAAVMMVATNFTGMSQEAGTADGENTIFPAPLQTGDKIAILAPSGHVKKELVDAAARELRKLGYDPVVYPTVRMRNGQLSGTMQQRFADIKDAILNPEIKAILCARGGFGLVHNLDSINALPLEENAKWIIGFSDISALHALLANRGIASVHGGMAHQLSRGVNDPENIHLINILKGYYPKYEFAAHPFNHEGHAEGKIVGGNFSVLQALIGTPYDIIQPGTILFIEDVGETIYKMERMMYQLRLAGVFDKLAGLVLGRFTEYKPGENYATMEAMMHEVLKDYPDLPVAFNVPIGHVRHNFPVVESSMGILDITKEGVTLKMEQK